MEIREIIGNTKDFFNEFVAPVHKITSVEEAENGGWVLTVEVIEEKEYMKKYAKDEMLGIYAVRLNENKEVASYRRTDIRYRSAIGQEV